MATDIEDWIADLPRSALIALAEHWGKNVAMKVTTRNIHDLQTFEEFLRNYYKVAVKPFQKEKE